MFKFINTYKIHVSIPLHEVAKISKLLVDNLPLCNIIKLYYKYGAGNDVKFVNHNKIMRRLKLTPDNLVSEAKEIYTDEGCEVNNISDLFERDIFLEHIAETRKMPHTWETYNKICERVSTKEQLMFLHEEIYECIPSEKIIHEIDHTILGLKTVDFDTHVVFKEFSSIAKVRAEMRKKFETLYVMPTNNYITAYDKKMKKAVRLEGKKRGGYTLKTDSKVLLKLLDTKRDEILAFLDLQHDSLPSTSVRGETKNILRRFLQNITPSTRKFKVICDVNKENCQVRELTRNKNKTTVKNYVYDFRRKESIMTNIYYINTVDLKELADILCDWDIFDLSRRMGVIDSKPFVRDMEKYRGMDDIEIFFANFMLSMRAYKLYDKLDLTGVKKMIKNVFDISKKLSPKVYKDPPIQKFKKVTIPAPKYW